VPSFWGEDGWVWYPSCYTYGWRCLLIDHTGYLQTISMLSALAAQPFPLVHAPEMFALIALAVQAAPAVFLASWRMETAVPRLGLRIVLALLLIAVPAMSEVYVNITNAQWHLSLLSFLVLVSRAPESKLGRFFDSAVLLLGGISGPFCVFLAPVAVLWWWVKRSRWAFWRGLIVLATATLQMALIVEHQSTRGASERVGLGASLRSFDTILINTVLGPATLGWQAMKRNGWLVTQNGWLYGADPAALALSTLIVAAAMLLAVVALWRGGWVLRCFLVFVAIEFLATLVDGLPISKTPLWAQLEPAVADRYSFHPMLAWLAILVSLAADRAWLWRVVGGALLACSLIFAAAGDWKLPPIPPTDFQAQARRFAAAPLGTVMNFQTRPLFYMTLTKK
jgi:hypothetical protein